MNHLPILSPIPSWHTAEVESSKLQGRRTQSATPLNRSFATHWTNRPISTPVSIRSTMNPSQMRCKISKTTPGPNENEHFDSSNPILTIGLLPILKLKCETNGIHEGAAMWLLHLFLQMSSAAALNSPIALLLESNRWKWEETMTTYFEVDYYFLEAYESDYFKA